MKFKKIEIWLILAFILMGNLITNGWLYSMLIGIFMLSLYLISGNFFRSAWLTFVPVYLFYRAVHITSSPFFVEYADPLLLLTSIILVSRKRENIYSYFRRHQRPAVHYAMLSIVMLGLFSTFFSPYFEVSLFYLLQLIKFFIVFLISGIILSDKYVRKLTINTIFLFILFNSVLILFQKANGGPLGLPAESPNLFSQFGRFADESPGLYRPGGITTSPNETATILGMTIPLAFVLGITKNGHKKLFIWVCLIFSATALLFTASRAAWAITILSLVMICTALKNFKFLDIPPVISKYWKILIVGSLILVLPPISNRMSSLATIFSPEGGGTYRIHHLVMSLNLAGDFPLGVGMNSFQYEIVKRFSPEYIFYDQTPAHNVFAEIMADFGYIGVPLFLILIYNIAKAHYPYNNLKTIAPFKLGVFWGVIVYIVLLQVHPWLFERSASSLFWILGGMISDGTE